MALDAMIWFHQETTEGSKKQTNKQRKNNNNNKTKTKNKTKKNKETN